MKYNEEQINDLFKVGAISSHDSYLLLTASDFKQEEKTVHKYKVGDKLNYVNLQLPQLFTGVCEVEVVEQEGVSNGVACYIVKNSTGYVHWAYEACLSPIVANAVAPISTTHKFKEGDEVVISGDIPGVGIPPKDARGVIIKLDHTAKVYGIETGQGFDAEYNLYYEHQLSLVSPITGLPYAPGIQCEHAVPLNRVCQPCVDATLGQCIYTDVAEEIFAKCECGAAKLGYNTHSSWCPKHE